MNIYLFDIDGTLLSTGGAGGSAFRETLAEEFGVTGEVAHVPMNGRTDRAIARDLFHHHGIADTPENWHRFRDSYLRRLPNHLAAKPGSVLPGIEAILQQLSGKDDVAVGLLTGNLQEGARLKLGYFGIYHHFSFGGFGDHHFHRNDVAQEAFKAVPEHCAGRVTLERVWVIGDTPLDIHCARAIGAQAVAVATGAYSMEELAAEKPDLLLPDLADPSPLLSLAMQIESFKRPNR